jgi:glyoxylase-like metal-dependent hydrolase (beta-lactamase superfamily II)
MTEVIPGIYQLKIPIPNNPLGHTNTYLIRWDDGYLLIDAGSDGDEALLALKNQLAEIGASYKDIIRIVVTHAHGDHYGLVNTLKQYTKAEIMLHYLEKEVLTGRYQNMEESFGQLEELFHINGAPDEEIQIPRFPISDMRRPAAPVLPDTTLKGGETIPVGDFRLQVLWTPGHSPGHICLYEPSRKIFFAGDHVLPVITPNISFRPNSRENPLGDFIDSLNTLKELDVELVLPAHEHIYTNFRERIDEIFLHHQHRNNEIMEMLEDGPKTAYQVSRNITWVPESGGIKFDNLPSMDKRMAVMETLAHLRAMAFNGEVEKFTRDGTDLFQKRT